MPQACRPFMPRTMVEVPHGVKVPSFAGTSAEARLFADTSAEPRQPNWPSNSLCLDRAA
jgi:hypothetical protein